MASPEIFDIPIGKVVGRKGDTGNGIAGIELLSTSGLQKTYRINMTNETHFDFVVTDGNGISGASFDPETNELTITFDNGTSFTTPSLKGVPGDPGDDGYSPAVTIETITGGHRVTITDKTHPTGQSFDVMDGASDAGNVSYDESATYQAGSVGAKLQEQTRQLSDETTGLDTKAPVILETVSGAIASFSDGADGMPIRKLVAQIEPVQDLHGYDHPWPGGGNVNLLPTAQSKTLNGITFAVQSDGSINISGTATAASSIDVGRREFTLPAGTYRYEYNAGTISGVSTSVWADGSPASLLLTGTGVFTTAEETNPFVRIAVTSGTTVNFTARPMISAGSDAYAYSPYSNECPISGHTGVEVTRTGENLIDWKVSSTAKAVYLKPGTYVLSWNGAFSQSGLWYMRAKDSSGNYYDSKSALGLDSSWTHSNSSHWNYSNTNQPIVFTVPSGCSVVEFFRQNTDGTIPAQLELGSTATDYASYTGNQISVIWEDEAGTVYGATMTLNPDRTGTLVADKGIIDLGTLTWHKGAEATGQFYSETDFGALNSTDIVCSEFRYGQAYAATEDNVIELRIGTYHRTWVRSTPYSGMTASEFKSAMSGVQLVYPLASPQTFQLTAEQVSGILSTLYGTNNIWSSTGDTEVTYPADTKIFIEKLTQPEEDDMTANANIAANTFFMIGNTLYFSTAAIAQGATIIPGTNCNVVSLADALNQLNT